MGASCCPINADTYEKLFLQADKALYIASEKGHNRYVIYDIEKHGEAIPKQQRSAADLYANIPTQSKAGFVADIAKSLLHAPRPDIQTLLQGIGAQFGVDGIQIFTAPDWKAAYSWGHPVGSAATVLAEEPFISGFPEDNCLVIDNINALEGLADNAYAWFSGESILGAVLFRVMRDEKPAGIISFGLFGRYHKWSTPDANHLTILGGILSALL